MLPRVIAKALTFIKCLFALEVLHDHCDRRSAAGRTVVLDHHRARAAERARTSALSRSAEGDVMID